MALHRDATFAYVFPISENPTSGGPVAGSPIESLAAGDVRLVGHAPVLEAVEYERTPWQLYARITLSASDPPNALAATVSFSIERGLVRVLRAGDVLHVARSHCGGIGLSILRDNHIVAAVGAVTKVPLGADVSVHAPGDLIGQVERLFQSRDPEFRLIDRPVQFSISGTTRILQTGQGASVGPYEIFVRHGYLLGLPGTDESVSIERRGVSPDTAARTSAELLAKEFIIGD